MKSFKQHMKDQVIEELVTEASLQDVQVLFPEIRLDVLEDGKEVQRFRLVALTNKGTKIQHEVGLSEFLSVGYIQNLIRSSYS
ncbi:TPA: hypothetical protein ACGU88_000895 [Vibrio vulnificus]|uniref:hypothetical protein n=1 Tax=Vibrio vulnificus TaxID=672 RepID=UPI002892BF8E|nr:hypothetical protein [Vibrio vulnificus]WNJ72075.1 hypothetical protein RI132_20285 [Vibrio vulnificus]